MLIKQAFQKRRLGILKNPQEATSPEEVSNDDVPHFIKSLTHEYQAASQEHAEGRGSPKTEDTMERARSALINGLNDLREDDFNAAVRAAERFITNNAGESAISYEAAPEPAMAA
ncbi:MAG: hypothetical protein CL570_01435 [Alphaproteobacteria bacterium]|nr:hypothetical protein [Alphaproteobacteria bacterium]HCQ70660.1 hypothetical protein [Rhodospirillaceae bacterium]|tara:strand:+ start:109117 stop:109461 length:345 start_codon:yes stop_codon:yes gene_type:complete